MARVFIFSCYVCGACASPRTTASPPLLQFATDEILVCGREDIYIHTRGRRAKGTLLTSTDLKYVGHQLTKNMPQVERTLPQLSRVSSETHLAHVLRLAVYPYTHNNMKQQTKNVDDVSAPIAPTTTFGRLPFKGREGELLVQGMIDLDLVMAKCQDDPATFMYLVEMAITTSIHRKGGNNMSTVFGGVYAPTAEQIVGWLLGEHVRNNVKPINVDKQQAEKWLAMVATATKIHGEEETLRRFNLKFAVGFAPAENNLESLAVLAARRRIRKAAVAAATAADKEAADTAELLG